MLFPPLHDLVGAPREAPHAAHPRRRALDQEDPRGVQAADVLPKGVLLPADLR